MFVAVLFVVSLGGLFVVMLCVQMMRVRQVGVMRSLFVMTRFVVLCSFMVMLGSVLVMLCCLFVMLVSFVGHGENPFCL